MKTTKVIWGQEKLPHEEGLKKFTLFSLDWRRSQGDLRVPFPVSREELTRKMERFFRLWSDRTRGNCFNWSLFQRAALDVKRKFITVKMLKHQYRLFREAEDAPTLDVFQARFHGAGGGLWGIQPIGRCPCPQQRVGTWWSLKDPSFPFYENTVVGFQYPDHQVCRSNINFCCCDRHGLALHIGRYFLISRKIPCVFFRIDINIIEWWYAVEKQKQ